MRVMISFNPLSAFNRYKNGHKQSSSCGVFQDIAKLIFPIHSANAWIASRLIRAIPISPDLRLLKIRGGAIYIFDGSTSLFYPMAMRDHGLISWMAITSPPDKCIFGIFDGVGISVMDGIGFFANRLRLGYPR